MKIAPGKFKALPVFLALLCALPLFASAEHVTTPFATIDYSLSKQQVKPYEPLTITFEATQLEHQHFMLFFITPKHDDAYTIELMTKSIHEPKPHYNTTTFTFVLFAKRTTDLSIAFSIEAKTASDQAVAQAYVEDHDDSVSIQMQSKQIALQPLHISVVPHSKPVQLVGDFTLSHTLDKTTMQANESANLIYTLQGVGAEINLTSLITAQDSLTLFSERDDSAMKLGSTGYTQANHYIYAISAEHNITLPDIELNAYSPSTQQYYTLKAPQQAIAVTPVDIEALLDKTNSPQPTSVIDWQWIKEYAHILFYTLIGFTLAKLLPKRLPLFWRKKDRKRFDDIRQAPSAKALLQRLLLHYSDAPLQKEIAQLEAHIYHASALRLSTIKRQIISVLEKSP